MLVACQAFIGDRGSRDIATQMFQFTVLIRSATHLSMQENRGQITVFSCFFLIHVLYDRRSSCDRINKLLPWNAQL
ncbi:hypothetical protein ABO04_11595 [Nitrosomonas sp. HPC101]|nr:hypothetical protein [Nitrosomonas sp. HPC101]